MRDLVGFGVLICAVVGRGGGPEHLLEYVGKFRAGDEGRWFGQAGGLAHDAERAQGSKVRKGHMQARVLLWLAQ